MELKENEINKDGINQYKAMFEVSLNNLKDFLSNFEKDFSNVDKRSLAVAKTNLETSELWVLKAIKEIEENL